jgi:F0F1-type ATP synthase assembly protein I
MFFVFLFIVFTVGFCLGIAVLARRASYFFAAAKKSNQKKPSLRLAPL